jgi:hypothetical protein
MEKQIKILVRKKVTSIRIIYKIKSVKNYFFKYLFYLNNLIKKFS